MKEKVLALIKDYLSRPDVQSNLIAAEVLLCLAGDIEVLAEEEQLAPQ
jgi:hypothetical protein